MNRWEATEFQSILVGPTRWQAVVVQIRADVSFRSGQRRSQGFLTLEAIRGADDSRDEG